MVFAKKLLSLQVTHGYLISHNYNNIHFEQLCMHEGIQFFLSCSCCQVTHYNNLNFCKALVGDAVKYAKGLVTFGLRKQPTYAVLVDSIP